MVAVTTVTVGTARTRAPLSGVPVPAPALPINGQATLGFFLPRILSRGIGVRDVSAESTAWRVPASECGSASSARNLSPRAAPGWVKISAQPLRRTSSIKRSEYSGTNELGAGHQVLRPRRPASGQQRAGTSYSPPPRWLHLSVPQLTPKVTAVPAPLRGPSLVSATSAPNQHGATREPKM